MSEQIRTRFKQSEVFNSSFLRDLEGHAIVESGNVDEDNVGQIIFTITVLAGKMDILTALVKSNGGHIIDEAAEAEAKREQFTIDDRIRILSGEEWEKLVDAAKCQSQTKGRLKRNPLFIKMTRELMQTILDSSGKGTLSALIKSRMLQTAKGGRYSLDDISDATLEWAKTLLKQAFGMEE